MSKERVPLEKIGRVVKYGGCLAAAGSFVAFCAGVISGDVALGVYGMVATPTAGGIAVVGEILSGDLYRVP